MPGSALLARAGGDAGELLPEHLLHLLHLLDALHRGRQPGLEDLLGIHRVEARLQPLLDLAHDAVLHRLDVGQAEEGAGLLGGAGHFDVHFHGQSPLFAGTLACYEPAMVTPWLAKNPRLDRDLAFGRAQQFVVNPDGIPELLAELSECPAHRVTPLHRLPALAERLGVGEVRVKDESQRFGFGAFKALGGVLAVYDVLAGAVGEATHSKPQFADVMAGKHREVTAKYIFTTASSGNHGRSVAAGAKLFGNRCVIFLPKFTSAEKEAAIR